MVDMNQALENEIDIHLHWLVEGIDRVFAGGLDIWKVQPNDASES